MPTAPIPPTTLVGSLSLSPAIFICAVHEILVITQVLVFKMFSNNFFGYWIFLIFSGIRVQSLKKGQITMDIDFRWGGDPSIILAVEAALVASIPIQVVHDIT